MKNIIAIILLLNVFQCEKRNKTICNDDFFECAHECSQICERTIEESWEFGKCFAICNEPCRKDYCKDACMVEMVDTKDLKSFAKIKRGGSSPSVSIILKRR